MTVEPRRLQELEAFDPRTIAIVRASCARLPADTVELTRKFYRHLFAMAPQTRVMFSEDMREQHERLLNGILAAVRALDRPHLVEEHLRRWGVVHRRAHGVTNELYVYVGHALVRALKQLLPDMESSVGSAWSAVYQWMAAVMIDGADQAELVDRHPSTLIAQDQVYDRPRTESYHASYQGVKYNTPAYDNPAYEHPAYEGATYATTQRDPMSSTPAAPAEAAEPTTRHAAVLPFRRSRGAA